MTQSDHSGPAELRQAISGSGGLLVAAFVFSAFINLLMFTGPLFMLQVYDRVLNSRSEETLLALFILVGVLFLVLGVLDFARDRLLMRFGNRFRKKLNARVFDAEISPRVAPFEVTGPTDGVQQLDVLHRFFSSPLMSALFDLPWVPLFFLVIFMFHPILGWTAFSGGVGLVILAGLNSALNAKSASSAQQLAARSKRLKSEVKRSSEFVTSQSMQEEVRYRWLALQSQFLLKVTIASDKSGAFISITKSVKLLLQSLMLAVGAWLTMNGELGAGAMIASSIILGRALTPIEQIIGSWSQIQQALRAWKNLGALLSFVPIKVAGITMPNPIAKLTFANVSILAQPSRRRLLGNVSFSIEPGQVVGVIGNSGAGKSTLAKAILRIVPTSIGEIRLGGANVTDYDPEQLGKLLGYLPQNVTFYDGNVLENIARMSQNIDHDKAISAAKSANVHELILSLPNGYATKLKGIQNQLSGGELQRIGLARALYSEPIVLVLDEPTSALDHAGTEALNKTIREFRDANHIVILMTHRPQAIVECDQILVLENGCLSAFGAKTEVLDKMIQTPQNVGISPHPTTDRQFAI